MGKIFKLNGRYREGTRPGVEWTENDPSFYGAILVEDNGNFCGYCNDTSVGYKLGIESGNFVYGILATNWRNQKKGIAFCRLSNRRKQDSSEFVCPDIEDPKSGHWFVYVHGFIKCGTYTKIGDKFVSQGDAIIELEEEPYVEVEAERIRELYGRLEKNEFNSILIKDTDNLKQLLDHYFEHQK